MMTSNRSPHHGLWRSFGYAFSLRPTATAAAVGVVPIGVATLILGEDASRAFTLIPGGALIAHLLGALMATGGIVATAGMLRLGTLTELFGLVLVAAGTFLYASGVLIGLGINGLIAAGLSSIICIGAAGRVFLLASIAHQLNNGNADDSRKR